MEIALFGAGFAGKRYLKALNYFYQCSKKEIVVHLYDTKQEALDSISDDYAFRIVKNLFEEDKPFYLPNHIIIAVNEYSHYYLILKIIKQAKSALKILVEKPFVENLNQLKDLMQYPNFTKHSWSLALVERFSPITQIAKVFVSKYLTNDNIRIEFFWGKDRSYDKRPTMGVLSEIIHPLDLCYYIFDFVPIDCYSNISYANYSIENKIKPAGIDVILKNSHKLAIGHASFLWPERNRQIFAFILKKKKKFLLNLNFDVHKWDCDSFSAYEIDQTKNEKYLLVQKLTTTHDFPKELTQIYKVYKMLFAFLNNSDNRTILPDLKSIVQTQSLLQECLDNDRLILRNVH